MTQSTFVPAVTETKTTAAKVTVELTLEQAAKLRGVLGECSQGVLSDLFNELSDMADEGLIENIEPSNAADIPAIKFE